MRRLDSERGQGEASSRPVIWLVRVRRVNFEGCGGSRTHAQVESSQWRLPPSPFGGSMDKTLN